MCCCWLSYIEESKAHAGEWEMNNKSAGKRERERERERERKREKERESVCVCVYVCVCVCVCLPLQESTQGNVEVVEISQFVGIRRLPRIHILCKALVLALVLCSHLE